MAVPYPIQFSRYHAHNLPEFGRHLTLTGTNTNTPGHSCGPQQINVDTPWIVLKSPVIPAEEISILRQKVKYLAVLPNMEGAVVLLDDGRGLLQPQTAFYVADNIIFVCDGTLRSARTVRMVLYRNPVMIFTSSWDGGEGVVFSTVDITSFLYSVGENVLMSKMLQTDGCYEVIDRFTLAMAFIYLKRADVTDYFFTNILSVLAAILLAHKMEEDDAPGRALLQLIHYCLPRGITKNEKLSFINSITSFQSILFQKIDYRGFVRVEECEEVISVSPYHPFWKRWRLSFHGGAIRDVHQEWKLQFIHVSFFSTIDAVNGENPTILIIQFMMWVSWRLNKCIMCKGNHHYSQDVHDRFTVQPSFSTQKLHLTHILSSVKEKHQKNLQKASSCPETGHYFENWSPSLTVSANIDTNWPIDYIQLFEIENRIENVLSDEKYLQKYVSMLKMKKLFPSFTAPVPMAF